MWERAGSWISMEETIGLSRGGEIVLDRYDDSLKCSLGFHSFGHSMNQFSRKRCEKCGKVIIPARP